MKDELKDVYAKYLTARQDYWNAYQAHKDASNAFRQLALKLSAEQSGIDERCLILLDHYGMRCDLSPSDYHVIHYRSEECIHCGRIPSEGVYEKSSN